MAWPVLTDAFITTLARKLIQEPVARYFSDAQIVRFINQGLTHLIENTNSYMGTVTKALTQGDYEYTAADMVMEDATGVRSVIFLDGASDTVPSTGARALLKMSEKHFNNLQAETQGDVLEYIWRQNTMYFWPQPADTNKVLVLYYKSLDSFDGDDFQNIPISYGTYLEWYVYGACLRAQGKHAQSEQYFSYFWNIVDYHRQDIAAELAYSDDDGTMNQLPDHTQYVGENVGG